MTISANAVTLAQFGIMSNDPLVKRVTFSLLDNGSVLADIPMQTQKTMIANGVRWEGNLPTVNWAAVNSEGTTTSGTPTPYQEQLYLIRNYIDTDRTIAEDQNVITNPREIQLAGYMKSVSYDFNHKFINNSHASGDSNAIVGIRARLDDPTNYGLKAVNKITANAVDMTQAGITVAIANTFVEYLDLLLWSVDSPSGQDVILYMNETMKRRFAFAMRTLGTQGGMRTDQDQFGRTLDMYKGAELRDIGYKADQSTRIITNTETTAGADGTSNYTSIYAVHYGMEHLSGWQYAPIEAIDQGLLENRVIYRTSINWAGGLYSSNNRSVGRLYDIKIS